MITGIDLDATIDYTLENDKENPTVWKLGIIPSLIFMKLTQKAKDNEIEASYQVLQIALKGWENLKNVEFKTVKQDFFGREMDVIHMDTLERIPTPHIVELAVKVMEINSVGEQEAKN